MGARSHLVMICWGLMMGSGIIWWRSGGIWRDLARLSFVGSSLLQCGDKVLMREIYRLRRLPNAWCCCLVAGGWQLRVGTVRVVRLVCRAACLNGCVHGGEAHARRVSLP